jgi:putative ABC transport system permease protein
MLKNHFKIAIRNLAKHKTYSVINILGLAIGIACFILIALWVRDEMSYDAYHVNAGRIYRVVIDFVSEHGVHDFARTAPLYAPTLEKDFPEIERAARFKTYGGVMKYGDNTFQENDMLIADPAVLQMFTFPFLKGDPATALSEPKSLVLSESMAQKYFGEENPLGKIILLNDTLDCTVTAVMADLPKTTHLDFNCLLSWETWRLLTPEKWLNTWANNIYYTYILLREGADAAQLREKLPAFADRHIIKGDQYAGCVIHLQPLTDIHLYSHRRQEMGTNSNIAYIYILSGVALLVLIIACINFMNLATARSLRRSKEVGLRKVVGAGRGHLIAQFLGESLLMSAFAMLLALMLMELVLPAFNDLSGKQIRLTEVLSPASLGAFLALTLLVGLAAGSYPALLLSGFRPVHLFKTGVQKGAAGVITRKALIVFQFVISIVLIIGTIVISGQLHYLRQQNLGFEKEQLVVLPFGWNRQVQQQIEPLKADLLNRSGIIDLTASGDVPGHMATTLSFWCEGMAEGESAGIVSLIVDPDFLRTYQIELAAGRDYSPEMPTDLRWRNWAGLHRSLPSASAFAFRVWKAGSSGW